MNTILERLAAPDIELLRECGRAAEALEARAFLVGGAVRDLLLETTSPDLDLVVEGDGMAVAQTLSRAHNGSLERHHAFQTATVVLEGGRRVDFATARSEEYARPGALPQVVPGRIRDDLQRRDFTINAIAVSVHQHDWGNLVDPFGGREDLRAGLLRVLHEQSFADDPTRILRGARFALRFDYAFESRTQAALDDAAEGRFLEDVSPDRLRRELVKIFAEHPIEGPRWLVRHSMLSVIHPGLTVPAVLLERLRAEPAAPSEDQAWRVLTALATDLDAQARWDLVKRLRLPADGRDLLIGAGAPLASALEDLRSKGNQAARSEVARVLDPLSSEVLAVAAFLVVEEPDLRSSIRRYVASEREVVPALDGSDLLELGCPAGPAVGELLGELRAGRIDGRIVDLEGERALVQKRLMKAN